MLHQQAQTFEPSVAKQTAFDAQAYIARARKLGLIIYPTISNDRHSYILTKPGQTGFSSRNLSLSTEFGNVMKAVPDATEQVFDALCDDFGVDPANPTFNERVHAILLHEDLRRQGDRKLIAVCRRAEKVVAEDHRIENHLSELGDSFMQIEDDLKRPVAEGVCRFLSGTSQEMHAEVKKHRAQTSPEAMAKMTAYIKTVTDWERRVQQAEDRHGLAAARRESAAAGSKTRKVLTELLGIEAVTVAGVAAKCRVMTACLDAGYGYDSQFEELARSIFDDGSRLDDRGGERPCRRARCASGEPRAQAH